MDVREQRVSFVVTASRGEKSFSALCQEYGITRPTGYLWLGRYRQEGLAGIAERSRRPWLSPGQTPPEMEARVVAWRECYPDWGARKLQVMLAREGLRLTRSTVHRILLRHGLVPQAEVACHAPQRFERSAPNELWQMDFKGPMGRGDKLGPLSILDDHSRYLLALRQVSGTGGAEVREHLEHTFDECGVPEAMLMDHGVPWWSGRAPHGLTGLSRWLMRQGIALHWGRIRHPQTQGKVERFHVELQRAVERRRPQTEDVQDWLDEFRWEHNHVRPHEALDMGTPASRWRPSPRCYVANPPAWEYEAGSRVLKVDSSGKIRLQGTHWNLSRALCGERVKLVTVEQRVLVYYCRTVIRELDLSNQRSTIVDRWLLNENPIQKL